MATFTWTVTATGTTASAWETPSGWVNPTDLSHPTTASFTTGPGSDYVINSANNFTIKEIGAGGTAAPDIANSLTLTGTPFAQATLLLHDGGGALDVTTMLDLEGGLLNLGTAVGGSVLSLGGTADGGTIFLGSTARLEGALGDKVVDIGASATEIMGSGTIIAEGGLFAFGPSVQVASGTSLKFQINANAELSFADAVSSGTVVFGTASGSGVLDVGALSTFNASVKGLFVGQSVDVATSYIDFLNVGTSATATLTNLTTQGATLTVFSNSGSHAIALIGNYTTSHANVNYVSDGKGGTNIFLTNAPCYAAGTAILTPDGEVAVETIQAGDLVLTSEAGRLVPQPVIWTGKREIDLVQHPRPAAVAPIRFRRGALGQDLPGRDLWLSPDHCLLLDGGLVPARLLVNGMTIVREIGVAAVAYHHLELARHAVLIAEGVEAESYLDTGNRAYFGNAGAAAMLYPERAINERFRGWEATACAPMITLPDDVRPLWERLAARAAGLGYAWPTQRTTSDPGVHLLVDGTVVAPVATAGDLLRFMIPATAATIRLLSRYAIPVEVRPWHDDPRVLGVAVRSMRLHDRGGETVLGADHPALTDGWHPAEYSGDGAPWRWTDGNAVLPIECDGPCMLEIILSASMVYADQDRVAA